MVYRRGNLLNIKDRTEKRGYFFVGIASVLHFLSFFYIISII